MRLVRKLLPYTTVALLIAAAYVAFVFWSRSDANAKVERARKEKEVEDAKKVVEMAGGDSLKILSFYASPAALHPGGDLKICYGVANATSVKMDPEVEPLKPVYNHCLVAHPRKSTHYTLTASDAKGHSVSESFDILVQ